MTRASGIGSIPKAAIAHLKAGTALAALVGGRVEGKPLPGTPYPYLAVSVRSEFPDDAIGAAGVDAVLEVLIISAYEGDQEIGRIATAVRDRLETAPLVVDGFIGPADVQYDQGLDGYDKVIAGVTVRHRPLWFRVQVT